MDAGVVSKALLSLFVLRSPHRVGKVTPVGHVVSLKHGVSLESSAPCDRFTS